MIFGRLLTAMVTPFDTKGRVNYQEAKKIARHLMENGNDGLVLIGTTGESPTLTLEEKIKLVEEVMEELKGQCKIVVGVGGNNTEEVIKTVKEFEKKGIDGIMVVTPYYNKPTQKGLYLHFEKIAQSTSLPIMLYNVPSRTGCNLLPQTVKELAKIENIVAIKEASGDLNQVSEIVRLCGDEIQVLSGDDSLTLPMLSVGAIGVVSVASHIVGKEIKEMIESFSKGDVKKATMIHLKLMPIFKNLFVESNPIPVKLAMNLIGFNAGQCRLPLCSPSDSTVDLIKKTLKELKQD
ncbi:4-hydroxy-tetrahydrodipicolinate synthase [Anaerobranca gottschalkii]|uniref:4-hydroxy-tetrahydrodipicolinate synthase n=1 Tax=Anaerobranca gottschalkii DSM 13577 TaxID=1120990 RepID=A0A1H9Z8N5_9FIRM|nr:4-hydroxy-tetrahydrodipicolinate synthase [Anaerobranca gottschalkii]SES77865.1 4-hydroxy-tetrahydrodipicolinate synthase [Anaerobranca gottschalkii DSM 13577]